MRTDHFYLNNFENIESHYNSTFPFSILHYAFMFRRFDKAEEIIKKNSLDLNNLLLANSTLPNYEWITPLVCAQWNISYISGYCEKNNSKLLNYINKVKDTSLNQNLITYDEKLKTDETVFSVFFDNQVPLLNIKYFEKQEIASKQLHKNNYSLILDEVGTGKTVSALYAMRDVIQNANMNQSKAKILIIAPHNKRLDWQDDIRRQLGRYSHVVEQSDNGLLYNGDLKRAYFKNTEHIIMICGQKQSQKDKNGSSSALKQELEKWSTKEKWDLIIVDEAHNSFKNYKDLRCRKMLMLTATPIVVNSYETRRFSDYESTMSIDTDCGYLWHSHIDPLENHNPNSDDYFVNWFKEDYGIESAERKITFIECPRHPMRMECCSLIEEYKSLLTALQYDQDDDYLFSETRKLVHALKENDELKDDIDIPEITENYKLKSLIEYLSNSDKSYIIFCEHKYVMNLIYKKLKNEFHDVIIGYKSGQTENYCGLSGVPDGQLINSLISNIRLGKRVFLITTGKTGGTGLNLGDFDGVVHYELPFTSIELEQRFGRVDRIDTKTANNSKDMVFILNKTSDDYPDSYVNRMLYYCSTKIDITAEYMPIRNTVLYYPKFILRNKENLIESIKQIQNSPYLTNKFIDELNKRNSEIRKLKNKIYKNFSYSSDIQKNTKSQVYKFCKETLNKERQYRITESTYMNMQKYVEEVDESKEINKTFKDFKKIYNETINNIKRWLSVLGISKLSINDLDEYFEYIDQETEQTEFSFDKNTNQSDDEDENIKESKYQTELNKYLKLLQKIDDKFMKNRGIIANGIFYYDMDKELIVRDSVPDFRKD